MARSSETGKLEAYLARIGADLDRFLRAEHGDAMQRHADWSTALSGPLPDAGIGPEGVIEELECDVIPNGMRLAEPGFWGFVTVAPDTVPTVATVAAMIASPQRYTITAFNRLEELSLEWLADLCGLPPAMKAVYSSGGSVANLVALGAARQWALERAGVDPSAEGLGASRLALYTSTEAHHTIQRSAGVLGVGRAKVRLIPRTLSSGSTWQRSAAQLQTTKPPASSRSPSWRPRAQPTRAPWTRSGRPARSRASTARVSTSTVRTDCLEASTSAWSRCTTDSSLRIP